MPLREYLCDACGHRFEVIQKMSDPPLEVCPKCGGVVHKLQAAPAFHLKGTGWYVTDYAKKDQSSESKKDGESRKEGESKKDGESRKDGESKKDGDSKRNSDSKDSPAGATGKAETKTDTARTTTSTESAAGTPTSNPGSTKSS
jgi:putative FmdB family regulatory protein